MALDHRYSVERLACSTLFPHTSFMRMPPEEFATAYFTCFFPIQFRFLARVAELLPRAGLVVRRLLIPLRGFRAGFVRCFGASGAASPSLPLGFGTAAAIDPSAVPTTRAAS